MNLAELLGDISRAFPFVNQPRQLILQEGDSIALQVRKVLLLRKLGIFKQQKGVINLLEGLFADDQSRELAILALGPGFLDLDSAINRDYITHILVLPDKWLFYKLSSQLVEQVTNLQLPFLNLNTLMAGTLISELGSTSRQIWLFDLQQLYQLSTLELASLFPSNDDANGWNTQIILFRMLNIGNHFPSILEKWLTALVSKTTNGDRKRILNALNAVIDFDFEMPWKRMEANMRISGLKEALFSHLETCKEPEIRILTLRVLSTLSQGKQARIELLIQGLSDPEEKVREVFATRASYEYRNITKPVQNKLWELMNDSSSEVRQASASTIIRKRLFKEADVPVLLKAAFRAPRKLSSNYFLLFQIRDLVSLAAPISTPQSFKLLNDEIKKLINKNFHDHSNRLIRMHWSWRDENVSFIKESLVYIISLFKSEDAVIRLNALQVWGTFKLNSISTSLVSPSLHVSRILPLLNDSDNRIRLMAINLLDTKDLGSFDVVDLLYKALQSNDTAIRVAAMGALRKGDVSSTNIVDKLLDILRSDDLEEAEKAALTLSKIKDTMLRQRVVIEAQQLISDSLKGKYAYDILWNLLVTTVKNSKSASLAL